MKTKRMTTLALAVLLSATSAMACNKPTEPKPSDTTPEGTISDYEVATKPANTDRDERDETEKNTNDFSNTDNPTDTTDKATDTAPDYEIYSIGSFSDGLAPIATSEGYGFIDMNGNITITPAYDEVADFYDGYARVRKDGKYGYIDKSGNPVIDLVYEDASAELKEVALVTKDGVKQYINREGAVVYTATGNEVAFGEFSNGYFWVETMEEKLSGNANTTSFYNAIGELWNSFTLRNYGEYTSPNKYGIFLLRLADDKALMYDLKASLPLYQGEVYSMQGSFVNGENGLYYIDYEKQEALPAQDLRQAEKWGQLGWTIAYSGFHNIYLSAPVWFDPLSPTLNKGYFDTSRILMENQIILDLHEIDEYSGTEQFQCIECSWVHFDEPRIVFTIRMISPDNVTFYSVIDEHGYVLVQPTSKIQLGYEYTGIDNYQGITSNTTYYVNYTFQSGLCKACDTQTGLFGYIDIHGNWIIPPQYNEATDFHVYGDNAVAVVNNNTIINRNGDVIFTIAQ